MSDQCDAAKKDIYYQRRYWEHLLANNHSVKGYNESPSLLKSYPSCQKKKKSPTNQRPKEMHMNYFHMPTETADQQILHGHFNVLAQKQTKFG